MQENAQRITTWYCYGNDGEGMKLGIAHNFGCKISRMSTSWKVWRQDVDKNDATLCPVEGTVVVLCQRYSTFRWGWRSEFYYQRRWTVRHYKKCLTFGLYYQLKCIFEFYTSDVEISSFATSEVEPSTNSYYQWHSTLGVYFFWCARTQIGPRPQTVEASISHTIRHTYKPGRNLNDRPALHRGCYQQRAQQTQQTNIHSLYYVCYIQWRGA
jgi:hypothetical protein